MTLRWVALAFLLGVAWPAPALAADACPDANADRLERYRAGPACWPAFQVDDNVDARPLGPLPPTPEVDQALRNLGETLFFDPRLSGSGQIACASCHDPEWGWADGREVPYGHDRQRGRRNTPSVANAAFLQAQFWDGRAATLQDQVLMPIANPEEMHGSPDEAVAAVNAIPGYAGLIRDAFGSATLDSQRLAEALSAYLTTLVTGTTRFDRFYGGDADALSETEIRGLDLFRTRAGCMNCHHGPLFTDGGFHNLGLHYYGRSNEDPGRYAVTGRAEDVGAFKTPGLRNVTETGPWMHNGKFGKLRGVLAIYNAGGAHPRRKGAQLDDPLFPVTSPLLKPLDLSQDELADLEAFLHSLENRRAPFFRVPELPQ
ncbi:cytochrome-c peroxidase [Alcanivorax marinus]|uniref:Cytochrome-c peroxidase n=1 Tax=Alloalcanivorax marinus TaxID=1177169 RepID=A0A9Q3UPP1_9GAMM|nr:cytochrome c peroxidase [Alloalcanivorax marinus]MCC4309806.1 cytochrome-c peroxidase [Alloalcanivorax marinus]